MTCPHDWKQTYATFEEVEAAIERTPARGPWDLKSPLIGYRCETHGGYHAGHAGAHGLPHRPGFWPKKPGYYQKVLR